MVKITPGVDYLTRSLVVLGLPVALVVILRHFTDEFDFFIPTWLLVCLSTLTVPFYVTTRIIYNEISERRQAAAVGARLAPKAQGKWIGNLDILTTMMKYWRTGYPGMFPCFVDPAAVSKCFNVNLSRWTMGAYGSTRPGVQYACFMGQLYCYSFPRTCQTNPG